MEDPTQTSSARDAKRKSDKSIHAEARPLAWEAGRAETPKTTLHACAHSGHHTDPRAEGSGEAARVYGLRPAVLASCLASRARALCVCDLPQKAACGGAESGGRGLGPDNGEHAEEGR